MSSSAFLITQTKPTAGRFVQPGDVRGWDRYAYVQGNPLRYADPSGHDICDELGFCYEKNRMDRINGQLSDVVSELTSIAIYNDMDYGGSVVLTAQGREFLGRYLMFVQTGEWLKWSQNPYQDPLFVFLAIVIGRESFPEIQDPSGKFHTRRDLVAEELFKNVFAGNVEGWITWMAGGEVTSYQDRRRYLMNYLGSEVQSAKIGVGTLRDKAFGYHMTTSDYAFDVAAFTFSGQVSKDYYNYAWANASNFEAEAVNVLEANKVAKYPQYDSDPMYIFSPSGREAVAPYRRGAKK